MFYLPYVVVLVNLEQLESVSWESLMRIQCPIILSMIFVMREALLVSLSIAQLVVLELPPNMF